MIVSMSVFFATFPMLAHNSELFKRCCSPDDAARIFSYYLKPRRRDSNLPVSKNAPTRDLLKDALPTELPHLKRY